MAMSYLVDASVIYRMRNDRMRAIVRTYSDTNSIFRASITDLEYGYSARNAAEWDLLSETLSVFGFLEVEPRHFKRALQVQRILSAKSQRGRKIPDLLLAAVAEEHNLTVLHYDSDFDLIAEATGQSCQWVIPAGTID